MSASHVLPASVAKPPLIERARVPAAEPARCWRMMARFALDGWEREATADAAQVVDLAARRLALRSGSGRPGGSDPCPPPSGGMSMPLPAFGARAA